MDVLLVTTGEVYCDTGRHDGQMRVDFRGSAYMDAEEFARYAEADLTVVIAEPEPA